MPIRKHPGTRLLVLFLLAAYAGCSGKSGDDRTAATGDDGGIAVRPAKTRKKTKPVYKPKPEEPPKIPTVVLSKEFEEKCRVFQNQPMPDAELTDLEGNAKTMKSLYGSKLTVVCFWSLSATPKGPQIIGLKQMLKDLAAIGGKFPATDVRLVGIDVKDPPDEAGKLLKEIDVTFTNLLDPQAAFFDKVGTDALPRIYLLDARGKILWFELLKLTSFDSSLRQLQFAAEIALRQEANETGS